VGKVQELALGYEGGVGAFATCAGAYSIDLNELADKVLVDAPVDVVAKADKFLEWFKKDKKSLYGLSDDAFVACDVLKRMWREAHPNTANYWAALKDLVVKALVNRGNTFNELGLKVRASKNWLLLGLPSGRALCYPAPKVEDGNKITYMGIDQYTRKWTRISTHGGKLFENLCQAVARDIMAANMPLIEAAGYRIVLTVHDEIIAEASDEPQYNAEHLASLLAANPSWAPDIPLAAAGFETYRYRKG
jgi:DNA polymerase